MSTIDPSGARAAVLARLWGAAAREPLPAIAHRSTTGPTLTITTHDGHTLTGPRIAAALFADPRHLAVTVNDSPITDPGVIATLLAAPHPHAARLGQEVTDSATGLGHARAAATGHPAAAELWTTARNHHPDASVYFEQLVTDGHPVHPLCRLRGGLDPIAHAPEHHPRVPLQLAPLDHAHQTGDWPWHDATGRPVLPIHPHQLHQRGHHPQAPTTGSLEAAPLMSLRTLAPYSHPHLHIKTALDVQLTSARRRVSAAAAHNGPLLSAAITEPGLVVQRELAALAADADGRPSPHLAAIIRQSPAAVLPDGHIAVPLAALAQPDPATRRPLIATVIDSTALPPAEWWRSLVAVVLPPLLRLAQRGIGLEAHGQNTLLALHNGTPTAVVYRDFGGVRVLDTTLPGLGIDHLHGDLTTGDPAVVHTKLIASAYSVTLGQLINAMAIAYDTPPDAWWAAVATTTAQHTARDLREALFAETWPLKATTAMRLSSDPTTDQWTPVPNPIAGQG